MVSARRTATAPCRLWGVGRRRGDAGLAEKIAIAIDVRRKIERVLARQALGQFGIAPLQRFDDLQMIDDRAGRAIVLRDGRAPDGAHVNQQIAGRIDDGLRAPERNDRGMERDVRIGILAQMFGRAASSGTRRTNAAAWRCPRRRHCSVASRAAIDSSAAHIWIISMISRLDLRMM